MNGPALLAIIGDEGRGYELDPTGLFFFFLFNCGSFSDIFKKMSLFFSFKDV